MPQRAQFDEKTREGRALVRGWATVDGRRIAIEERHRQLAYTREEIERALDAASLSPIEVIDFDPFGESRRVKLFYLCRALS